MAATGAWKAGMISQAVIASNAANEGAKLASQVYQRALVLGMAPNRLRPEFSVEGLAGMRSEVEEVRAAAARDIATLAARGGNRRVRRWTR
jgi:hypothetical protein